MATTEEVFKIIQQVEGGEKVDALKAKVDAIPPALDRVRDASGRFVGGMKAVKAQVDDTDASIERFLKRSVAAGDGLDAVGKGGKGGGRALLEFSRAAEDAQYGIAGILNNIPGLVQAMGGSAGLVGVISLAVVGAYQLYKNWDTLTAGLSGGIPQPALTGVELLAENLKKASEEIETLGKKSSLTWFELQRLQKLQADVKTMKADQKDTADFQNLMEGTSKGDQERGKAFTAALNEAGPKNASDELTGNLAEGKDAKGLVFNPVSRTFTTPEKASKDLILAASKGDEMAQAEIKKSLKANSGFGAKIDENAVGAEDARKDAAKEEVDYEKFRLDQEKDYQDKLAREQAAAAERTQRINDKVAEDQANDSAKAFEAQVKEATKSRSFLRKDREEMTPAELLAEQDWKKQEAKIEEASRNRSWMTDDGMEKDDEALTPEEKIAKRRADEDEKRADKVRKEQADAPGMGDFVKEALLSGFSDGAIGSKLADLGIDAVGQGDILKEGRKGAYEQLLSESEGQVTSSQTMAGGALRDAIQGGVKNEPDLMQKQLDRLFAMEGYLRDIAEKRTDYTAIAG